MSRYPQFDRDSLFIRPLHERVHDLSLDIMIPLDVPNPLPNEEGLKKTARRMVSAEKNKRSVIMGMGAHVIRAGTTPHLVGRRVKACRNTFRRENSAFGARRVG